jgi:hypothetical protein
MLSLYAAAFLLTIIYYREYTNTILIQLGVCFFARYFSRILQILPIFWSFTPCVIIGFSVLQTTHYLHFHSEIFWFRQQVLPKRKNKPSIMGRAKPHKTSTVRQDYRTEKRTCLAYINTRKPWRTSAFFFSACCLHSQGLSN